MSVSLSWQARRRARQSPQTVTVHIDALVLHGFAQTDALVVAEALSDELSLLAAQPASVGPRHTERLAAAPYAAAGLHDVGQRVAASLWASVQQGGQKR